MPNSVHGRLQLGAAILNALANRRTRTGNPDLHLSLEARIVQRELDELEQECRAAEQQRQNPSHRPVA